MKHWLKDILAMLFLIMLLLALWSLAVGLAWGQNEWKTMGVGKHWLIEYKTEMVDKTTICIQPIAYTQEDVNESREAATKVLQAQGHRVVDCNSEHDAVLLFYPYTGRTTGDTFFAIRAVQSGNTVLGTLSAHQLSTTYSGWIFELHNKGLGRVMYRDSRASDVKNGVKRFIEIHAKAKKQRQRQSPTKDGRK